MTKKCNKIIHRHYIREVFSGHSVLMREFKSSKKKHENKDCILLATLYILMDKINIVTIFLLF